MRKRYHLILVIIYLPFYKPFEIDQMIEGYFNYKISLV